MTDTIQDRLRGMVPTGRPFTVSERFEADQTSKEAAAHIDAQDAKIKALVEAGEAMNPRRIGYGESMCQASFDKAWGNLSTAILSAKEPK